eukprot:GHRQ01022936.1.p1 GENE.GHRQ01022936.1~~GHRQ01022936.1.p1  ORF type:complete len:228 (-),score=35.71 GHRQ01022936.1:541-1224(-)
MRLMKPRLLTVTRLGVLGTTSSSLCSAASGDTVCTHSTQHAQCSTLAGGYYAQHPARPALTTGWCLIRTAHSTRHTARPVLTAGWWWVCTDSFSTLWAVVRATAAGLLDMFCTPARRQRVAHQELPEEAHAFCGHSARESWWSSSLMWRPHHDAGAARSAVLVCCCLRLLQDDLQLPPLAGQQVLQATTTHRSTSTEELHTMVKEQHAHARDNRLRTLPRRSLPTTL